MESIEKLLENLLKHYEKKEYAAAERLVDALLAAHPDYHRAWFMKSVILEETGRPAEAESCYQKAGNLPMLFFRLALQLQEADPQRAIIYYDKVSQADPKNNMVWLHKGLLHEKMGNLDAARACFRNLSPAKDIIAKVVVPLGFISFLLVIMVTMIERGDITITVLVILSAVFCFFLLKRDGGPAVQMLLKKQKYR